MNEKTHQLSQVVRKDVYERIRSAAFNERISMAEFIRRSIEERLARVEKANKKRTSST